MYRVLKKLIINKIKRYGEQTLPLTDPMTVKNRDYTHPIAGSAEPFSSLIHAEQYSVEILLEIFEQLRLGRQLLRLAVIQLRER